MTLTDEKTCLATPGFAGFVPSLRYQFGATYGNATRHILDTDPSLKQGKIQQAHKSTTPPTKPMEVWTTRNKFSTGDDRLSFPPVPGYTGFIPRSKQHFGMPFVETTSESLNDFYKMQNYKAQLPPRVEKVLKEHPNITHVDRKQQEYTKPTFCYSAKANLKDEAGPYKAPKGHPNQVFISGYTGYVPRLHKHFGESYASSVRRAIEEFVEEKPKQVDYHVLMNQPSRKSRLKLFRDAPSSFQEVDMDSQRLLVRLVKLRTIHSITGIIAADFQLEHQIV